MHKINIIIIGIVFLLFIAPLSNAQAQDIFNGGEGANLQVKDSKDVKIAKETLNIKMHLGYSEVEANYTLKNLGLDQKVTFRFPQVVTNKILEDNVTNFSISAENQKLDTGITKEPKDSSYTIWRSFELDLKANETKTVKVAFWQINGANFAGVRTFSYNLKDTNQKIYDFDLNLYLMDDITIASFDRTQNPDFDIKIEPLNWKQINNVLTWHWDELDPGFNIVANLYWPKGNLAKIVDLEKDLSLYSVTALSNNENAWQAADSSYLTAWKEETEGTGEKQTLKFQFENNKKIEEFRIIAGKANSLEDFWANGRPQNITLDFGNNETEIISLENVLLNQYFKLKKAYETNEVTLTIDSVYQGKINPDDTYISEVEFGNITKPLSEIQIIQNAFNEKKLSWSQKIGRTFGNIGNWFKKIF